MSYTQKENAHAVVLPAFATSQLSDSVRRFLAKGGCSILAGETREEYVAREMSKKRRQEETAQTLLALTAEAASLAGNVLVAVDQEIGGICRLHDLVPPFPAAEQIKEMYIEEFEVLCSRMALAAKQLGINCFLGPILDTVTGDNPWLQGRTWSTDPMVISQVSCAYIHGIQANGVAATAKHFPGYANISLDPAIDPEARMTATLKSLENGFIPFANAIRNGVEMVMTGPALVEAIDSEKPASISPTVIQLLRKRFGFKGVIMSDDLDAQATLRGRPITRVAVDALNAGSDLLLIADKSDQVEKIILAINNAVHKGELAESRLVEAATKVRNLTHKYNAFVA